MTRAGTGRTARRAGRWIAALLAVAAFTAACGKYGPPEPYPPEPRPPQAEDEEQEERR